MITSNYGPFTQAALKSRFFCCLHCIIGFLLCQQDFHRAVD